MRWADRLKRALWLVGVFCCAVWATTAGNLPPSYGILIEGTWSEESKLFVATDPANLNQYYVAGTFSGTISVGGLRVTSAGKRDGFVIGFERPMRPMWIKSFGGPADDSLTSITGSNKGGYLATLTCGGGWAETPTYTIGDVVYTGRGSYDAVVLYGDPFGNVTWSRNDGDDVSEIPTSAFEFQDNIYVTGNFYQRSRFGNEFVSDPGTSTVYIQKLTSSGNHAWVRCTQGVELNSGYRGLAVIPTAFGNSSAGLSCTVGLAGGVAWGTASFDSVDEVRPFIPAALLIDEQGANQKIVVLDGCNADSMSAHIHPSNVIVTAATEHADCSPDLETSLIIRTGFPNPIVRRLPTANNQTSVSKLSALPGVRVFAAGKVENWIYPGFPHDTVKAMSTSGTDGLIFILNEVGEPLYITTLGASEWARATDITISPSEILTTAVVSGTVPLLGGDALVAKGPTAALFVFYTPVTGVHENAGSVNRAVNDGVDVYSILGEHLGCYQTSEGAMAELPSGRYILRSQSGTYLLSIVR